MGRPKKEKVRELEYYTQLFTRMIDADKQRDEAFKYYDRVYHNEWELPAELAALQWIRAVKSTEGADAVEAGVRVLTALEPKPKFHPPLDNVETKEAANEVEKILTWQLKSANRRRPISVQADLVKSSLLYASTAAIVIDLDQHIKQVKKSGGDTKYLKMLRRQSRFAVATYPPRNVHVIRDNFGTRAVLLAVERSAQEVIDEWGLDNEGLEELAKEGKSVGYYDYMDYDARVVLCIESGASLVGGEDEKGVVEIIKRDHGLPFLPWAALMGGSTLEEKEENKYHPLLYSLRTSGNWENVNIARTLYMSEAIAHAAAPRTKEEGPNEERAEIDYGDPLQSIKAPPGNAVSPFPPPMLDQGMVAVDDRLTSSINQSTVSRILMGGDVAAGTSFASLNLQTQTALGALKPAKELAEKTLSEIFVLMLLWSKFTGVALTAYGSDKHTDLGKQYLLEPDAIAEDELYIETELIADLPTDKMQRANTAGMMIQSMNYPQEYALEDMGVNDPQKAIAVSYFEKMVAQIWEMAKQREMAELQAKMAERQAKLQMEMQNQQAQEASQAEAQQLALQGQTGAQESGMPGGQGFNTAMGGQPPATAAPGMTREFFQGGLPGEGGLNVEEGV